MRGISLALREWPGAGQPFVLLHGLASNACTWDAVGALLSGYGHRVIALDQRGHGRSDKPESGYGFEEVTADLHSLIEALALERPVVAGQSWGGNVVLEYAARWPDAPAGIVLVDGGFIDLSQRPDATWEKVAEELKPPALAGTPRPAMVERMRSYHPAWGEAAIEMQMGNFETLPDGTIRPWLTLERHMAILRALWEARPTQLYARVEAPTLIAAADAPPGRQARKQQQVAAAGAAIPRARVQWFAGAAHDIHVDQPAELAEWILAALAEGFFD